MLTAPVAVQARVFAFTAQATFAWPVTPLTPLSGCTLYVGPLGSASARMVCPLAKLAAPLPPLAMAGDQSHGVPRVVAPLRLLLFATVSAGSWVMVVGSLAVLLLVLSSPPPDTMAWLTTLAGALVATSTVS